MPDPRVLLVAEIHGRAGTVSELRSILSDLAAGAQEEPGSDSFRVLDAEDRGELVLLASWRDEAALRAHYQAPHYKRYRDRVGAFLARPSDVVLHTLAATVHARDPNPPEPGLFG